MRKALIKFSMAILTALQPLAARAVDVKPQTSIKEIYRQVDSARQRLHMVATNEDLIALFGEGLTSAEKEYLKNQLAGLGHRRGILKGLHTHLASDGKLSIYVESQRMAVLEFVDMPNQKVLINGKAFQYRPQASLITMHKEISALLSQNHKPARVSLFLLPFQSQKAEAMVQFTLVESLLGVALAYFVANAFVCPAITDNAEDRWVRCGVFWPATLLFDAAVITWNSIRDAGLKIRGPIEANITEVQCRRSPREQERRVNEYGVAVQIPGDAGVAYSGAKFVIPKYELSGTMEIKPETTPPVIEFHFDEEGTNKGVKTSVVTVPLTQDLMPQDKILDASGPVSWSGQGNALKNASFAKDIVEICKDRERQEKVNAFLRNNPQGVTAAAIKSTVK